MWSNLVFGYSHSSRSTSSDENLQAYRTVVSHLKTVENSVQQKQQVAFFGCFFILWLYM